jgi:hypothetical protein
MKRDTEHKITLEDLLRLKRAERPPTEFWTTFESELRAKQLAAIVVQRPFWHNASRLFAPFYRHSVSIGAVAALALAWVGVRYETAPVQAPRIVLMARTQSVAAAVASMRVPMAAEVAPTSVAAPRVAQAPAPAPVTLAVTNVSHVVQAPVSVQPEPVREPFAEGIQVTFADFRAAAPESAQRDVFGSDRDFEASVTPVRQQNSDPLAQMDPSAERRARLLAPALPAYTSANSGSPSRDWMKERSSDDRRYESMDLYGSNDRAVVGFRF